MKKNEKILELYNQGLTNKEIKELTGFDDSTIRWGINKNGLKSRKYSLKKYDHEFYEFVLGTMLGDSSMANGFNSRMSIGHGLKQKDYCEYKHKFFNKYDLAGKISEYTQKNDRYKNGECTTIGFRTLTNPVFTKLYDKFYKDKIKIVPDEDYLHEFLTPFSLSIWFGDDGSTCSYSQLEIATESFSDGEVNRLRYILLEKYGIKTTNYKNIIRIRAQSVPFFKSLIGEYLLESLHYKLFPKKYK